jgi:D-3-phosphoglycerate dehydrogenase
VSREPGGRRGDVKPTVLVTSRSFSTGSLDLVATLESEGMDVVRGPADHDLTQIQEPLERAVAWIAGTGPVTEAHLAVARHLQIVARYGVGVDAVDLAAAAQHDIVVTNTPGANTHAVADHTLALLLAASRGIVAGDRRVRAGDWSVRRGRELGRLTVGIVGFGRIGRAVCALLEALGSDLLVHDPYVAPETVRAHGAEPATLEDLAHRCDAVTLHAPGGARLVTSEWLALIRRGSLLVNTARADLVDEAAVAAALRDGRLACYAADTLANESEARGSPLLDAELADAVIITPHVAAQTTEAVDAMGAAAVSDVLAVISSRPPLHPVRSEALP